MARAIEPVSVNGTEFDALIESDEGYSAKVPSYPVETGFSVSDNAAIEPLTLKMTLIVTATPVTWAARHGGGLSWIEQCCTGLLTTFIDREPITVTTQDAVYNNMVISAINIKKSASQGYSRNIPIEFKQVTITSAEAVEIPSSYSRSGKTGQKTGTANVSSAAGGGSSDLSGMSGSSSGASGGSSTSTGSASSLVSGNGNDNSILKNLVDSGRNGLVMKNLFGGG